MRIDHFEVLDTIASGGMGVVYRARDTAVERVVALKLLLAGREATEHQRARFEQEARALAALNHPNIAQVYGLEPGDETVIVMELVEGEDLGERLDDEHVLGDDGHAGDPTGEDQPAAGARGHPAEDLEGVVW